jgi:hypothetical protein
VDDNQLIELSVKIDNSILRWAEEYKASGLAMSAVMLARMMLLCDSIGSGEDFRKLCLEVAGKEIYEQEVSLH